MMEASPGGSGTQAVERAIAILRCVAALQRNGATLGSVVRATGLNRSTAFRILQSLVEQRMLAIDDATRQYRIGPLAAELGLAGGSLERLVAPWRAPLERVAQRTGMTTYLVARSGNDVVCLETVQPDVVLRAVTLTTGQRLPLGIGAGSLAILSSLADHEMRSAIEATQAQRSALPAPTLSRDELLRRVEATRQKGFAYSTGSVAEGIIGIGITLEAQDGVSQLAASVSKVSRGETDAEQRKIASMLREEFGVSDPSRQNAA